MGGDVRVWHAPARPSHCLALLDVVQVESGVVLLIEHCGGLSAPAQSLMPSVIKPRGNAEESCSHLL